MAFGHYLFFRAIKGTLRTDVNNLNSEIEKFKLRWDATKPKEEALDSSGNTANVQASIRLIKEKRKEWDEILERKSKILNDHAHFGIGKCISLKWIFLNIWMYFDINLTKNIFVYFCT